ncbi:hypothetical protein O181_001380 [Austropuccinia psidii MF-1]|uniref:Reverse transcriptase Ty1/copia-type domain-containing protein n=1 Tax=Austropuccinia psidii MF-1 TaxID=1389203 RepID=A0A9Q3GBS4_9BASI|nr:hypothetical protein [Austropuccinia psidii MF-1]
MMGGWLLWYLEAEKLIQSASVVFPQFQLEKVLAGQLKKGSLPHILNPMTLGEVPTEKYLADKNKEISFLPLAKDIAIPEHLGQALGGPCQGNWRKACMVELDQMKQRDVWEVIDKTPGMTPIGHRCIFDIKRNTNGTVEREGTATEEITVWHETGSDQEVIAIWIHINDQVITSNLPGAVSRFKTVLLSWRPTHDAPLPVLPEGSAKTSPEALDPAPYQSVVGSLAYLVSRSRPDLAFAVNYLARHSMKPTAERWLLLDHVVGYLFKTCTHGICLCPAKLALSLWSDVGWGGDLECPQSGFILKLGDAPIHWSSKFQTVVALSTCAAEYVALPDSTQHMVQAINQLTQIKGKLGKTIFCNNQAAVQLSIDNHFQKRMRYLDRAFFL